MGEQNCSSKTPKFPGCGLLEFPGLHHHHGIPHEARVSSGRRELPPAIPHRSHPCRPLGAAPSFEHLPGLWTF